MNPLDRPIWGALASRHAPLAEGGNLARRYKSPMTPFAAARDDSAESLQALGSLAREGEGLLLIYSDPITAPDGMVATMTAAAVQLVAERPLVVENDDCIEQLGEADIPEMLALAELTKPGPFSPRALSLGDFWGIREKGALVAMAGERMKLDGFTEISGVCAHPDARGRGFARLLSMYVAGRVVERGETPFLHAYATNTPAVALYQSIGFALRSTMHVAVLQRA
jgi:ribosomal protein S18 acetylase RimI-like enzyme